MRKTGALGLVGSTAPLELVSAHRPQRVLAFFTNPPSCSEASSQPGLCLCWAELGLGSYCHGAEQWTLITLSQTSWRV